MTESSGRSFEVRALAIARAIHDPSGTQGPVMVDGQERDAVFINDTAIVAFEFTQMPTKDKAVKDGGKLAGLLKKLASDPSNRYKSSLGYFVTEQEPTADQRTAVQKVSSDTGVPLRAMSFSSLQRSLVDAEIYISTRLNAPFGSANYRLPDVTDRKIDYVHPTIAVGADTFTVDQLATTIAGGQRGVATADFGAGKSELLYQVFIRLRKAYFKNPSSERIPVHINLRECYGLRSATEVLRRHAEEIGFPNERSLISAWRAGAAVLLLDGFDEIIPIRWGGGARDLRNVRWQALEPVRRLIEETPSDCGVLVAGRPQYFGGNSELIETLGLPQDAIVCRLQDFDGEQIQRLLGDGSISLPEWVPSRPLLLKYLALTGLLERLASDEDFDQASAWHALLTLLSKRESDRLSTMPPERVRDLIARIATLARGADGAGEAGQGELTLSSMREAFKDVCGYEAEEEGLQLLLRMPGIASDGSGDEADVRRFVDSDLAKSAYGLDLAKYVAAPYIGLHPLEAGVNWSANTGELSAGVAIYDLEQSGYEASHVHVAINQRMDQDICDAVMFDLLTMASLAEVEAPSTAQPYFRELLIEDLVPHGEDSYFSKSIFADCVIDNLDLTEVDSATEVPVFQDCLISTLHGYPAVPDSLAGKLSGAEIDAFSSSVDTTAGVSALGVDTEVRIALVILKKVYRQSGAGRRKSALARGLPLEDRGLVSGVLDRLIALGLLTAVTRKTETIVLAVKGRRAEIEAYMHDPSTLVL